VRTEVRVYLAGSVFSAFERERNADLARRLRAAGYAVFLPQEIRSVDRPRPPADEIFTRCAEGIDEVDVLVALVDGADVDSGTAWEIGYAFARKKPVFALRTDYRSAEHGTVNIMIEHSATLIARNAPKTSVDEAISELIATLADRIQ
jgi:nucleoside 2-deoxyribosyltransferase